LATSPTPLRSDCGPIAPTLRLKWKDADYQSGRTFFTNARRGRNTASSGNSHYSKSGGTTNSGRHHMPLVSQSNRSTHAEQKKDSLDEVRIARFPATLPYSLRSAQRDNVKPTMLGVQRPNKGLATREQLPQYMWDLTLKTELDLLSRPKRRVETRQEGKT
jgi:hypothetical protein